MPIYRYVEYDIECDECHEGIDIELGIFTWADAARYAKGKGWKIYRSGKCMCPKCIVLLGILKELSK